MRLLILLLFLLSLSLQGQSSLFDVLHVDSDSAVMRIDTDWDKLVRKKKDKSYQLATVALTFNDTTLNFTGKIRSRGNIRLEVCQNPSLKLKLKKKDLLAAGYSGLNEFKFVLQCSNSRVGENYLDRERLVYDLHAVYSDYSHRTIPITLDFGDGDISQAFMVEHGEQLAARFNAKVLESGRVSTRGLQRQAYVNMCLFNYLILNTDWHVFNIHNLKFISQNGSLDLIPIPYDFDYSGFVGTHYAIPREELEIGSIYVPKWLGKNVTAAEILAGAEHYLSRRKAAERLINEFPTLDKRDRKRLLRRIEVFYKVLEDEGKLLKLLN